MSEPVPTLSVVVATRDGWPSYRPMFDAQRRSVEAVGGELIVVDGSGKAPPAPGVLGGSAAWLRDPGGSVLALRARGYRAARAPIVAQSEDHCLVPSDWAAAILRVHAEFPEAAAIGGSVDNASVSSAVERASFLVGHGRYVPPLGIGVRASVLGLVNVSYKRWAIEAIEPVAGIGVNEVMHQRALSRAGATLLMDDRIRAEHVQVIGLQAASTLHFHAGRAMAAMRRARMSPGEWLRVLVTPISPPVLLARLAVILFRRPRYRREFLSSMPLVLWLFACRATGELAGYATGAGDSPARLH
jgi:hypothetical protein